MPNSIANSSPESQKRRSSRIVQAVPLTVTGVDALGRPFQERTSTLIINCHGCRYQSKHYVLKNMWVTLEVPHPEAGHDPRTVRARVMWIRRPHTVREPFQVGVELEVTGNLWGIAFPPADWFPFPEGITAAGAPAPSEVTAETALEALGVDVVEESFAPAPMPSAFEDNVRTMPLGSASEPSLQLARQMTRLVTEAKQQLQTVIRESAAQAVSAEARPLIATLQSQLKDVANQTVDAAVEQALQGVLQQATQAGDQQLQQMHESWTRQLNESIDKASQILSARVGEMEQERRDRVAQEIELESQRATENVQCVTQIFQVKLAEAQETFERLVQQASNVLAPAVAETEERLRAQSEEARRQITAFEGVARHWQDQIQATAASLQAGWQARLESDMDVAGGRWNERIETSFERAVQQAADRLTRRSQEAADQIERETSLRISALGKELTGASSEAEQRLATLCSALDNQMARTHAILTQVEASGRKIQEQREQLDAVGQTMLQEMEQRYHTLLDLQVQELTDRAETALAAWSERLHPTLEAAGREIVTRLGSDLENDFGTRLDRVGQALAQLESGTRAAEEAARRHGINLDKASEQSLQAMLDRLQGAIGRLEHDFEESSRTTMAKWIAEIDAKATETTHTTFESLFKTAEWYEKKVNNQMQASLEKGLEQAKDALREKAGEISSLFAAEMDHYSRSYVEHTHGQIEEAAREAIEAVHKQSAEMSAVSASAITQQAQNQTEAALEQLRGKAGAAMNHISSQLDSITAQARTKFDADVQQTQVGLRANLVQAIRQTLNQSRQEMATQVESAKEEVRNEGDNCTAQIRQTLGSMGDQALDSYRQRLDGASNTWLLTTVTKLDQNSTEQLEALARAAEARLRETCAQVFASVGESLRRRLLDLSPQPARQDPTPNLQANTDQK